MESVYIETSVLSYLTARPSRNLIAAARQRITTGWWDKQNYRIFTSNVVIAESGQGDTECSQLRLGIIKDIPRLAITPECHRLAEKLIADCVLPENAQDDALHIAVSSCHYTDFLLTWNCRHLANAHIILKIRKLIESEGYKFSQICTPEELIGE